MTQATQIDMLNGRILYLKTDTECNKYICKNNVIKRYDKENNIFVKTDIKPYAELFNVK